MAGAGAGLQTLRCPRLLSSLFLSARYGWAERKSNLKYTIDRLHQDSVTSI